jgi:dipeptidyl aminopeptidase/acylaminoacyl peptidase
MTNYHLYGLIRIIFLGCMIQGCSAVETATISPSALDTQPIEISPSLPPSLPPTTLIPGATSTSTTTTTLIPFTQIPTTVVPEPTDTQTFTPSLPGYLAFSVWGVPPNGIAVINSDGSDLRWVTNKYSSGLYDDPTWSPDGHWIAFTLYFLSESDNEIYIVNVDGSGVKRITYDDQWSFSLAWSPDGQKIAFTAPELYVLNLENGGSRRIGASLQITGGPAWSPDGEQIAVQGTDEGGEYYLYIIDVNEDNVTQATDYQIGSGRTSWSPDGRQIAYRSGDGCGDICILKLEDGTHHCLISTAGGERDPAWSPDGKHIAFLATQESELCQYQVTFEPLMLDWQVFLMHVDGTGITKRTHTSETKYGLAWSPVPLLQIGSSYTITEWGDRLTVRDTPSLSGAFVTQLLRGDMVTILEGPVDAEDYYWWRLRTEDGIEGWAVEVYRWYQPVGE